MANETVKKQIESALAHGMKIGGNPNIADKLAALGVDTSHGSRIIPWEDFIEKVFSESQKKSALERVKAIPEIPDLPLPVVVGIYREILRCITLGMNGAAITLSSILVEYMLKYASFTTEAGGFQKYDAIKWDKYEENITFHTAIESAHRNGLLTKNRRDSLMNFKKLIRNPYLHYNIKKITAGMIKKNVPRINLETETQETVDLLADANPIIWADAKAFADEKEVIHVFTYANEFVKEMWRKLSKLGRAPDTA